MNKQKITENLTLFLEERYKRNYLSLDEMRFELQDENFNGPSTHKEEGRYNIKDVIDALFASPSDDV